MIVDSPTSPSTTPSRGTFVVLEGVDRCGKSTQCNMLWKHLTSLGMAALSLRFPDRTTATGQLIDKYLQSSQELDDRAIHLLFSANRWEAAPKMKQNLLGGTNIVCDRYAYSGVAFTSAKSLVSESSADPNSLGSSISLDWCKSPDVGLPEPDVIIFLDLSQDEAEKRGGYGEERYEKKELQLKVRQRFEELKIQDEQDGKVPWHVVDASQTIDQVHQDIISIVEKTMNLVTKTKAPIGCLWEKH